MVTTTGRTQPRSEVRDRIAEAATKHFSTSGYAGASLRQIAEDAGTTKPMIFYYFGSKEGLYAATMQDAFDRLRATLEHVARPELPPLERIATLLRAYLERFAADEQRTALVLREVFGLGGVMQRLGATLEQAVRLPIEQIIRDGQRTEVFRTIDPKGASAAILGIVNHFILRRVFSGEPVDVDATLEHAVGVYGRGLLREARSG